MVAWRQWARRLLVWNGLWQVGLRLTRMLLPSPRPGWLEGEPLVLLRRAIWRPEHLLGRLALREGMRVVEVETGTGRLALPLAQRIGTRGMVIATDHRAEVLEQLQIARLEAGATQVVLCTTNGVSLPSEAAGADLIVISDVFGRLPDKQEFALAAYRALRPGGMVAVTETVLDPDFSLASTVITHLVLAGFGIEAERGMPLAYTVIGRKPT